MIEKIRKSKKKYIALTISVVLGIALLTGCGDDGGAATSTSGEVVAKVDDVEITKDELYDLLVDQHGAQALDSLIGEKMIEMDLEEKGIEVTDEEIEEELNEIIEQSGGEDVFEQIIAQQGMTLDQMKDNISLNMKIKKVLEPYIEVTDQQVEDFFEENKESLAEGEQVNASHILVETEEEAKDIKAELDDGKDFAELAKEHSTDPGSKESGGELGFFPRGQMVASFDEAAFSLKEGEISEPIESEHGYHIILVHEKKEAEEAKLENFQEDIKEGLIEEQIPEAYNEWYQEQYQKHKVTNNLIEG